MTDSPRQIHRLIVTTPGQVQTILRAQIEGFVQRGLGIWPSVCTVSLCEGERDILPEPDDLSQIINIDIDLGLDTDSVVVEDWDLVDAREVHYGSTDYDPQRRPLSWVWTLEDGRRRLHGQKGGSLFQGVLNRLRPSGVIIGRVENSALVQHCIDAIKTLTYREGPTLPAGLVTSLNAFDPPVELIWRGAHAPTELQRLLEWTRHAFAFNQDGTYSIHRLKDPGQALISPSMSEAKLPGASVTLGDEAPTKCIIASCPTRNLIERKRTLDTPRPLTWVGVDVDGSIGPLEGLSWWPVGKTPIQVWVGKFTHVDPRYQDLARASVFRMLQLHDDDLTQGWTLVSRLLDEQTDVLERGIPLASRLKAKAALQNEKGMWVPQTDLVPISDVSIDLERSVITCGSALVKLDGATDKPQNEIGAAALGSGDLELTFCHHPNAGDYTDYYMAVFEWDTGTSTVVQVTGATAISDAIAQGVPIYYFPDLQLHYLEEAHPSINVNPVNDATLNALALVYAKSFISTGTPELRIEQYPMLHDVDPDGSVSAIIWDGNNLVTTLRLGNYFQITSEYAQRVAVHRDRTGGSHGAPRGGGAASAGVARGATSLPSGGSQGPSTGKRETTSLAVPALPTTRPVLHTPFWAKIASQISANTYTFTQVYKSNTGSGAVWTNGSFTGSASEFNAARVAIGVIVLMWPVPIFKADGSVVIEYWFDSGGGNLCLTSGGGLLADVNGCIGNDLTTNSQVVATVVTGGSLSLVAGTPNKLRLTLNRGVVTFNRNGAGMVIGVAVAATSDITSDLNLDECA